MSKQTSKVLASGRFLESTRPKPHFGRDKPCGKMILYARPDDLQIIEAAARTVTPADLVGVELSGNANGRAIAAICKQWLGRKA